MTAQSYSNFVFTDYRSPALELGTFALAFSFLVLGLCPEMFHYPSKVANGISVLVGLLLAGLVIWASQSLLCQDRALELSEQKIMEVTCFSKWFAWRRVRVLAEFDDIRAVYLSPKVDLWSRHHAWLYPVVLLTRDGESIVVSNQSQSRDRDNYSIPKAQEIADLLGCGVHHGDEETPITAVQRGQEFSFEAKSQDVGMLGRFLALTALVGLVWGLWRLTQF